MNRLFERRSQKILCAENPEKRRNPPVKIQEMIIPSVVLVTGKFQSWWLDRMHFDFSGPQGLGCRERNIRE
jgi:hypothetical protein